LSTPAPSPVSALVKPTTPALFQSSFAIAAILFLVTITLYLPALGNGFVNYDDPAYVTSNRHVLNGLSWSNVEWAIRTTDEANWHPLTWLSHMADVQMFGLSPRWHHFSSVLLHGLNVVLLFLLLRRATGNVLRSAMVGALFAVHPLNVECVAWVAERKSLLSMMFLLLAFLAYGWYVERRTVGRYALVFVLFGLGLAAKPMIVTLPVLFLLWDYWPLQRWSGSQDGTWQTWFRLMAEKIPLLLLSAASSWITVYAQHRGGALSNAALLPIGLRIQNVIYSYAAYLGKGIWPAKLAVFYPHPEGGLGVGTIALAALLVLAICVITWTLRHTHRFLVAGWLWYVIALLPMIGIVQVGRQAMADRYSYLPFVGLFIAAVWGVSDLTCRLRTPKFAALAIASVILLGYGTATFVQVHYWSNSYALFSHTLEVTRHNGIAEDNFGVALMELGRPDLALPHFQAAAEYIPELATAHYNLGVLLQQQGRSQDASREYGLTLRYSSDPRELAQAHSNLGFLLLDDQPAEASDQFSEALEINPEKQNALLGRGIAQYRLRNLEAAIKDFGRASSLGPSPQAQFWLGRALEDSGRKEAAISAYEGALQLAPGMTEAQQRLNSLRNP